MRADVSGTLLVKQFSAQYKNRTGAYSASGSFHDHAYDLIVLNDGKIRYKPKIKVSGKKTLTTTSFSNDYAVDRWRVNKFYEFDFIPGLVFRINKAAHNIVADKAELTLIQC